MAARPERLQRDDREVEGHGEERQVVAHHLLKRIWHGGHRQYRHSAPAWCEGTLPQLATTEKCSAGRAVPRRALGRGCGTFPTGTYPPPRLRSALMNAVLELLV